MNFIENKSVILVDNFKDIKMALAITDATFDEVVLKSDKPVMVDFWAAWCGPKVNHNWLIW